jgi:hypothetical protein
VVAAERRARRAAGVPDGLGQAREPSLAEVEAALEASVAEPRQGLGGLVSAAPATSASASARAVLARADGDDGGWRTHLPSWFPFRAYSDVEMEERLRKRLAAIEAQLARDDAYRRVQEARVQVYDAEVRAMREQPERFMDEAAGAATAGAPGGKAAGVARA